VGDQFQHLEGQLGHENSSSSTATVAVGGLRSAWVVKSTMSANSTVTSPKALE
jgi:hypothetical protein